MSNSSSYAVIAKAVLLVGVMLAVLLLSSRFHDSAHANVDGGTIEIPENSDATVVAYTAVDPEGYTVVWSVSGTDAADFSVEEGALTFDDTPDYEAPTDRAGTSRANNNDYEVTVVATDGQGEETERLLMIKIINVDEDGVVTFTPLHPKEDTPLTASVTDPDGFANNNTTTWQWSRSSSKTGTFIDITENGTLNPYPPVAADVGKYLRATASYDDREGKYKYAALVSDDPVLAKDYVNAPPAFKDAEGEAITTIGRELKENSAAGTAVGDPITATDNDANGDPETLTYTLEGTDKGKFAIDSKTGQISVGTRTTLDFETPSSTAVTNVYSVMVKATDPSNAPTVDPSRMDAVNPHLTVKITVVNVEESPTIDPPETNNLGEVTAGHATRSYAESTDDTPNSTVVSPYTATDDEDDNDLPVKPLKWSLSGADSSKLKISNDAGTRGQLTFKSSPDYEAPSSADRDNVYEVTVTVTDSTGNTDSRDVAVRVTDVDEPGTVTLLSLQPEAGHDLMAELNDPDGETSGVTWSWASTPENVPCDNLQTDDGLWGDPITGAASATYETSDGDTNRCLRVTANYTDAEGPGKSAAAISAHQVQPNDTNNQDPVFEDAQDDPITSTTRQVHENIAPNSDQTPNPGNVGAAVEATDDEENPTRTDNLTYSLDSGTDAKAFNINRATGQLSVKAALDYEKKRSYRVTVTATDPSSDSDTIRVDITVINVDEPPVISGAALGEYPENGTSAVVTFTASDPERAGTIEWTLLGADFASFTIERGALKFKSPPDYEDPLGGDNVYNVMVKARDADGHTSEEDVEVIVTNLDEKGTIILVPSQPKEGVQLTAMLTDPDGDVSGLTWQWARSSSKTGTYVDIQEDNPSNTYMPKPVDVGKYLRTTASYNDPEGKFKTAFVVSDSKVLAKDYVNQPPVFHDSEGEAITTTARKVAEDARTGAPVGTPVKATDNNARGNPERLAYTLLDDEDVDSDSDPDTPAEMDGDSTKFAINSRTGQISVGAGAMLDFESSKNTYTVTVTATDPSNLPSDAITVTITVTNVEESPKITGETATIDYEEKSTDDVADYDATDDEDGSDDPKKPLTWSLAGDDADDFCIDDAGVLAFESSPDYEAPTDTGRNNTYQVTVEATDSGGRTASQSVTVRVTNVEENGTVTLSTLQPQDGIPLTVTLTDPDGGISSRKWKWEWAASGSQECSEVDSGWRVITRTNAKSATYTPVKDDEGDCLRATASYTDKARTPDDSTTAQDESIDTAHVVSAKEVQSADTDNTAPEFPDQDPNTDGVQNKTVTISVDENTAAGEPVGEPVPAAADHDGDTTATGDGEILTYSLGDVDANLFTIERDTGQIKVGAGTKLDHEAKDTYTVTVTATDPSLDSASITVTIRVTDVDEAPELSAKSLVILGRRGLDYLENDRSTVATYTASGPQASRVSWTLLGDDAGDFSLSGGRLTFRGTPNYESPADRNTDNVYNITVRARDSGGNIALLEVTVRVANVDEDGAVTLSPSRAAVGVELTARLTDPDGRSGDTPPITGAATDLTDDAAWRWARSPDGSSGWTNIVGATSNTYTPVAAAAGAYLRATASYTDAEGSGKRAEAESGRVTAVAPDGRVSLSSSRPEVGLGLTATVTDPDGGVTGVTWQWARSQDGSTGWNDIFGATSATYRPVAADLGDYLRATATYTDAEASGQTASAVSGVVIAGQPDGTVTLSSSQPEVEVQLTATLTDPDGGITGTTWRWAKSPDGSTGWADIAGATSMTYTPVDADVGAYLRATARYTDAQASGQTANAVSGAVVAVQEDGVVTLSSSQPEVGVELTATLTDPDGGVTGTTWQWARSPDGSTGWADIAGATSMTYKPVEADVGMYLRATASYTDGQGSGQTAIGVSGAATERDLVSRYDANENGQIEKDEAIRAVQDYFSDLITKAEVLTVIQLYFAS